MSENKNRKQKFFRNRHKSYFYLHLHCLLNLIFTITFFSISKKQIRLLSNNYSEIHLTISPGGDQDILYSALKS